MSKTKPSSPSNPNKKAKASDKASADLFPAQGPVSQAQEMSKYGISRVPVDYFHYGDFRYTNLDDAISQAKRGCAGLSVIAASPSQQK